MTIHIEQILYGNFPEKGFVRRSSPRVNQWLDQTSLAKLLRQGCNEPTTTWTMLNNNKIARSFIKPTRDANGRKTFYNHTIVMKVQDLLEILNADNITEKYLQKNITTPPDRLNSIEV